MKMALTTLMLATAVSAPALARAPAHTMDAMSARASVGQSFNVPAGNSLGVASTDVFVNGRFAGRDPDANVRFELSREFGTNR